MYRIIGGTWIRFLKRYILHSSSVITFYTPFSTTKNCSKKKSTQYFQTDMDFFFEIFKKSVFDVDAEHLEQIIYIMWKIWKTIEFPLKSKKRAWTKELWKLDFWSSTLKKLLSRIGQYSSTRPVFILLITFIVFNYRCFGSLHILLIRTHTFDRYYIQIFCKIMKDMVFIYYFILPFKIKG